MNVFVSFSRAWIDTVTCIQLHGNGKRRRDDVNDGKYLFLGWAKSSLPSLPYLPSRFSLYQPWANPLKSPMMFHLIVLKGHSWFWICTESSTETTTEAFLSTDSSGGNINPSSVALSTRVPRTLHVMQHGIFIYMLMIRNTPPHRRRRLKSPLLTIIKHSEVNEKSTLRVNFNRRWFFQRKQRRNFDIYVYQLPGARVDRNVRVKRNHQIIRRHSWSMKVEVQRPQHRTSPVERRERKHRTWDDLCSSSHRILSRG